MPTTAGGPRALERLPAETLQAIVLSIAWEVGGPPPLDSVDLESEGYARRRYNPTILARTARVSRRLAAVARPLLYRHVEVNSLAALHGLAAVLEATPALAAEVLSLRFEYTHGEREAEELARQHCEEQRWDEERDGYRDDWIGEQACNLRDELEDNRDSVHALCRNLRRLEIDTLLSGRFFEQLPPSCVSIVVDAVVLPHLTQLLRAARSIVHVAIGEIIDNQAPGLGEDVLASLVQLSVYHNEPVSDPSKLPITPFELAGAGANLARLRCHWSSLLGAQREWLQDLTALRVLEIRVPDGQHQSRFDVEPTAHQLFHALQLLPARLVELTFAWESRDVVRPAFLNDAKGRRGRCSVAFVAHLADAVRAIAPSDGPQRLVLRDAPLWEDGAEGDEETASLLVACQGASIKLVCPRPLDQGDELAVLGGA